MDFLREVKAKLEELEKLSQEAQSQAGQQSVKDLFTPKNQLDKPAGRAAQSSSKKSRSDRQDPKRTSQRQESEFQAVDLRPRSRGQAPPPQAKPPKSSIFDDLGDRLDEAFLLQEVLGPPRCVREWE